MVTSLYAGLLGLIYIGLSIVVINGRWKYKIEIGDAGNDDLTRRIRVHGNYLEYTTIFLILMFLAEQENTSETFLHVLGSAFILSRLMHAYGFYKSKGTSIGRSGGMMLSFLSITVAALICVKAFFIF